MGVNNNNYGNKNTLIKNNFKRYDYSLFLRVIVDTQDIFFSPEKLSLNVIKLFKK